MSDVINFLKENPLVYLVTNGLDGNAKGRPIYFYYEENGKPYFCTENTKPMFKELDANPNCEIVVANPEFEWLRIAGEVEFTDSLDLKQKVIDSHEVVKTLYETPENPTFEVFTIKGKATIADFSEEPPKTYEL